MDKLELINKLNHLKRVNDNYKKLDHQIKTLLIKVDSKYYYLYRYMNQIPMDLDDDYFGLNFAINNIYLDINRGELLNKLLSIKATVNGDNVQKSLTKYDDLGSKYFADFVDQFGDYVPIDVYPNVKDQINYNTNAYYFGFYSVDKTEKPRPATVKDVKDLINITIDELGYHHVSSKDLQKLEDKILDDPNSKYDAENIAKKLWDDGITDRINNDWYDYKGEKIEDVIGDLDALIDDPDGIGSVNDQDDSVYSLINCVKSNDNIAL